MRVLFIMRHSGYVRNFESTLRLLCERKHEVHLAFQAKERHWLLDTTDIAQQLAGQYPNLTQGTVPLRTDEWAQLGATARLGLDYLRYLGPEYREATKLRQRVERQVEPAIARIAQRGVAGRSGLATVLRQVDRSIPRDPEIDAYFRLQRPDLVLVTPLVEPGSPQIDYLRSARAMGVRTVFCVASWDNLTNKGLIHEPVDLVTVWNESMKAEAVRMHGVPPDRVAVTGAQPFDHWFDWRPSTSRADFCARVGLDPVEPYLLYVCSSKFVAPDEAPFVRTWVQHLRASGSGRLRKAGVLVRPHPQNWEQWGRFDRSGLTNFAVHPPAGAAPIDDGTKAEYFDSIFHSAAIVGINTTAEIESAIVGRKVFTVLDPAFKDTQEGTLHFHYLRHVNGGMLHVARNLSEHNEQLDAALAAGNDDDGRCRRFVEAFVRPYGVTVAATPRLVQALEDLAARPPIRDSAWSLLAPVIRRLVRPLAARLQREAAAEARAKAERDAAKQARRERHAALAREVKTPEEPKREKPEAQATRIEPEKAPGGALYVAALAAGFEALGRADRIRFLQQIANGIPPKVWFGLQRADAERLDFPDATILMHVSSKRERVRLRACAKEPWTVAWIQRAVRPDEVLYDIGANVGGYSLIAAKKPGGGSRVVAFEASYANVAALYANVVLNDVAELVTPLPVALSDANSLDVFNLTSTGPGGARHSLGRLEPHEGPTSYAQPVLTFRLDDLVEQFGLPRPHHVKLDVDGGELAVLAGAARTLAALDLRSVLVEVSSELSEPVTRALAVHGLELQSRVRVRNKAGEFRVWYGLFTRPGAGLDALAATGDQVVER